MALSKFALFTGVAASVGAGRLVGPGESRSARATSSGDAVRVSVRDFGAEGDGRTDDAGAVQRAVDAVARRNEAAGAGGVVYFPPGVYAVSQPLAVPKNIFLVGETPIASRLNYIGIDVGPLVTFGEAGQIATYSGIRDLWLESNGKTQSSVLMYGPQEGSTLDGAMLTGARKTVIEIRSEGIEGGSNKFTVSRCWCWTNGDDATAGILIGPSSGPLAIRDTTFVGTNRTRAAPEDSGGVVAERSLITIDNVNVEHFESHTYLDRTQASIRDVTGFFNTYGVKTSAQSTDTAIYLSGASFDQANASILDQGSDVRIGFCRSYWNEAYRSDRRQFRRNFWEVGSVNVFQSDSAQATIGYTSPGTGDTSRFKFSVLQDGQWQTAADIDASGRLGAAQSSFNGAHLRLGDYHLWVDGEGSLRMKRGAPNSDTDGGVVGT